MLELGDGKKLAEQSVLAESLRQQIQGDGRSNVAVALAAHAPASALTHAAKASAAAGATIIELLVTTPQTLSVPAGDYWAGRLDSNQVTRLAAIPISLALLGATAAGPGGKPRATNWDPSRAALRLYLVVDQKKWTLTSPTGRVATIVSATDRNDAVKALRKTLAEVRLAFPDEDALVVVPGRNLTLGALASAIDAAARDAKGRRLFSRIALAESAPKVVKNSLGRRIQRRWRATVTVNPQSLAPRIAVARGCYQSLLEKNGKLAARLRLEVSNGVAKVTDGPKNKKLRACATTALGATMAAGGIISATITFGPK